MSVKKRTYPESFPEGCPPKESQECRLKVYRLTKGEIVTEQDFKSYKDLGINKVLKEYPFAEYGLSVYTSYEELKKVCRSTPSLKKKFKNIASGTTYECTGVVQKTPLKNQETHYTWWVCKGINPSNFFCIEGGESLETQK